MSFSVRLADYQSRLAVKEADLKKKKKKGKEKKTKTFLFPRMDKELADQSKEGGRRIQGWTLLSSKVAWAGKPVQRMRKRASPSGEVPAVCAVFCEFLWNVRTTQSRVLCSSALHFGCQTAEELLVPVSDLMNLGASSMSMILHFHAPCFPSFPLHQLVFVRIVFVDFYIAGFYKKREKCN